MSRRYLGSYLSTSTPSSNTLYAPGIWSAQQQFVGQGSGTWPIGLPVNIVFVQSVDFASTANAPTGPTIPSNVDDSYFGVLMEYTSAFNVTSTVPPNGWTKVVYDPDPLQASTAALTIHYKILSTADRGLTPGAFGSNQRDQLFVFRNTLGSLSGRNILIGNLQKSQTTGALSAAAPTSGQSAIAIQYFYNSTTATPPISSNPSMTLVRSTVNNFHGGQYKIYNTGETPLNQTTDATLAGTIRQALFWLYFA